MNAKKIITGERILLRPLELADVGPAYVRWMNDKKIQEYTRRRGQQITAVELKKFIRDGKKTPDVHFAIIVADTGTHIGNIFLNSVSRQNKSAELSIMIGDAAEQGKGYAAEAIYLASRFAFDTLLLTRLGAGSPNPAFNALMKKLGWKKEGVLREAFRKGQEYIDIVLWSLLQKEFSAHGK